MMGRIRGFSLKHRVATIFRRGFRRGYRRIGGNPGRVEPLSRLFRWINAKAKAILCKNMDGYRRVGQDEIPKGHVAVYVGQKEGDFERILVPLVFINHPLFGDLLKEAENEFGYSHPGGLTIPCRISEFESVQTRIKADEIW
ncbi:hypothetical protein SASPL_109107 [Salvia splendens]|uniref:SAUR family protein n=1 Tax=Salvia splendens TaxID=180675 RepID=A0A8X8YHY2_SALSN|nr:hypothetical protein SASPL_109107 [Salvia splendens]